MFAQAVPAAMQVLCVGGGVLGRSYVWLLQSDRDLMPLISVLSDVRLETALDDSHALPVVCLICEHCSATHTAR